MKRLADDLVDFQTQYPCWVEYNGGSGQYPDYGWYTVYTDDPEEGGKEVGDIYEKKDGSIWGEEKVIEKILQETA